MAVPSFVTTGVLSVSASAATLTPALPASRVNNNILIAFASVSATNKTITTATTGWANIDSIKTGNLSASYWWRIVDGTEAAPVFTWTGAAACQAQVHQFTGNLTSLPIGVKNSATANASTTITAASLTSTVSNSLIIGALIASTSQTVPLPTNYTNIVTNASVDGSSRICSGTAYLSGSATDAISVAITSANWASFAFELKGSSTTSNEPAIRASQSAAEVLESYSNPTNLLVSQSAAEVLESYSNPTNVIVSQVAIQVLRTITNPPPLSRGFIIS